MIWIIEPGGLTGTRVLHKYATTPKTTAEIEQATTQRRVKLQQKWEREKELCCIIRSTAPASERLSAIVEYMKHRVGHPSKADMKMLQELIQATEFEQQLLNNGNPAPLHKVTATLEVVACSNTQQIKRDSKRRNEAF